MKSLRINNGLIGKVVIPGDKSISHRSIILNSISNGKARVEGLVSGEDCISTIKIGKNKPVFLIMMIKIM